MSTSWKERRVELDIVRISLVLGLVFFHASLVFDTRDDFYVKNDQTTAVTTILAGPIVIWAMPILFTVSGIAACMSLRRRQPLLFARERLLRLGLPLITATVLLLPVAQWLRARSTAPELGYLEFLPQFFTVRLDPGEFPFLLQGEYFESGHLWFVVLLLVWSLLLAGLVRAIPAGLARSARERLATAVSGRPSLLLVPCAVLAPVSAWFGMEEDFAAWSRWAYLVFFLLGFLLGVDERIRAAVRDFATVAGLWALGLFAIGMTLFVLAGETVLFVADTAPAIGFRSLYGATGWCAVVALLGLLDRWATGTRSRRTSGATPERAVTSRTKVFGYLTAAGLPIYVLHQPIVVAVAYLVVPWQTAGIAVLVEYAVIVVSSFVVILGVYELVVRRSRVARFLFGMSGAASAPHREPVKP